MLAASNDLAYQGRMIKKLSLAAAALAVLIVVAVLIFLRSTGPSNPAELIPEDTVFYVSANDLPRSFLRWQGTALAALGKEPEVKAFLEKPLAMLASQNGVDETGRILAGLKPGRIFLAVTGLTTKTLDALIGFQYWGGRSEFDSAVARMRQELPAGEPPTVETYEGEEIVGTRHGKLTVFTATAGRWGLVSSRVELVRSALDRVHGRAHSPALAANPRFLEVGKRMLKSADFAFFLQPQPVLDVLLEAGHSVGADPVPDQVEALRATEAVGGSLKFDGELQRDALFFLRKGAKPAEVLSHQSSRFTSPETVVFVDFLARFAGLSTLMDKALAGSAPQDSIVEFTELATAGFGPQCAVVVNWGTGQMAPSVVFTAGVRDAAKADEALGKLMSFFPETRIVEQDGIKLFSIPSVSNPLASPTLTLSGGFMILGIDAKSVLQAAHAGGAGVDASPAFAPALPAYRAANEVFAFVNTGAIFERAYTALRPVILFGAQVMPGMAVWIDTGKLPQTETVVRHLPPVILSQQRFEDGVLLESSGPFTASQLAISAAVGGVMSAQKKP